MINVRISSKIFNPIYKRFLHAVSYIQIFFGGASSGKSVFVAQRAVIDLMEGNRNYLVVREVYKDLKNSAFAEMRQVIESNSDLAKLFYITENPLRIRCKENSREAVFVGLDDVENIKSIRPRRGVFTDVWIEEATQISKNSFKQIRKRLRGQSVAKRITMTFNPILKSHWIYKDFFQGWNDESDILETGKLLILRTTYKDNVFLTEQDRENLENEEDLYFYNVYTLGKWGVLGNVIFRNWETADLSNLKKLWGRQIYGGLDFGFTHPAAALSVGYDAENKTIYVFDEAGGTGLSNQALYRETTKLMATNFNCDAAEPRSILELQNLGLSCQSADKGKDSVIYGIKWLQRLKIVIDVSCTRLKAELSSYKWVEKRDGTVIEQPVDKNNHWIDALRYAVELIHNYELAGSGRVNVAHL